MTGQRAGLYPHEIVEKIASRSHWPKRSPDTSFALRRYTLWLPFPPS